MTGNITVVKYIYKYQTLKQAKRIIFKNELFFASPDQFNDPFDCSTAFSVADCDEDDFIRHCEKMVSRAEKDGLNLPKSFMYNGRLADRELQKEMIHDFENALRSVNSKLGVLCLSEVPDDILMWSHYSNSHQGVVLEFNKEGLEAHYGYCERVDYKDRMVTLKEYNEINSLSESARLFLLRKSTHWKYEREWRVIRTRSNIYEKFPLDILKGIILGCQMSETDKIVIQKWLKKAKIDIKVSQAVRSDSEYSVKIVP